MKKIMLILAVVLIFSSVAVIFVKKEDNSFKSYVDDFLGIADMPAKKAPYEVSKTYVLYEILSEGGGKNTVSVPPSMAIGSTTKFLYTVESGKEGYVMYSNNTSTKTFFPSYEGSYGVYEYTWEDLGQDAYTVGDFKSCYVINEPWPDNPNKNDILNYSDFKRVSGNYKYQSKIRVEAGELYLLTVKSDDGERQKVSLESGSICELYRGTHLKDGKTYAYTQYIVNTHSGDDILKVRLDDDDCTLQIQKIAVYPMDEYFYDPEIPEGPGAE